MAFVKTFWDLKTNITYTTHTIGSFDNNTTTGGGDFEWIPNVNNSTIVDIAGMQIKPASSPTGYWKRVWNGPLNVGVVWMSKWYIYPIHILAVRCFTIYIEY